MDAIVNVTQDWGIGYKGKLVSHIEEDMKHFKYQTINKCIIYGNNTLKSFPNKAPLKNRINIVITKDYSNIDKQSIEHATIIKSVIKKNPEMLVDSNSLELQKFLNKEEYLKKPLLIVATSIEQAIEFARNIFSENSIVICGGASIYEQMLPLCNTVMVTKNYYKGPVDSFFPNLDEDPNWVLTRTHPLLKIITDSVEDNTKFDIKKREICSYNIYRKADYYISDHYWSDLK